MKLRFELSQYCTDAVRSEGERLWNEGALRDVRTEPAGTAALRLSARCPDSFNFVDHPRLTVSAEGDRLLSFRCDCPEARRTDEFCAHCAALALSAGAGKQPAPTARGAAAKSAAVSGGAQPDAAEEGVQIVDLSYAFANSRGDMYPGVEYPQIPLERFQLFFKGLYAQALYEDQGEWGGNCFGVSSTSAMFYQQGNGVALSDFARRVAFPGQLRREDENAAWKLSLLGFIEAMQIAQYHPDINEMRAAIWDVALDEKLKLICAAVQSFQESGNVLLVLDVWEDANGSGGHCIFPYRWERTGARSERLTVYDPNWPQTERYIDLETDAAGRYVNWRFPMFDDLTYSGDRGGLLTFMPFANAQQTWDKRGEELTMAMFTARCSGLTLCDADGTPVARVRGGAVEPLREDVLPIRVSSGKPGAQPSFWVRPGVYRVRSDTPEEEQLAFRFLTENQSIETKTELRELVVELDDEKEACAVLIPQEEQERLRERERQQEDAEEEKQEEQEVSFWVRLRSFMQEVVLDTVKKLLVTGCYDAAILLLRKLPALIGRLVPIVFTVNGAHVDPETLRSDAVPEELRRFLAQPEEREEVQKQRIANAAADPQK